MIREIKNAKISSTKLGIEDHGILSFMLNLDYAGSGQGFGGYALDDYSKLTKERHGTAFGMEVINRLLKLFGCTWEGLPGKVCRVDADYNKVYRIGHFLEDKWLDLAEVAKDFKDYNGK